MEKEKRVVAIEEYCGKWSIYEESGQVLEIDFESKQDAIDYASYMSWIIVERFNV